MRNFIALILIVGSISVQAQSLTTRDLHKKHGDALAGFFYNNTLRMLNQTDNKEFDALIKDIEKMKFLMIDKSKDFKTSDYKKLLSDYKSESFEEIMTSRSEGKSFDVFIKEKEGITKGMLVLINDSSNLFVLDIVGKIALDKVTNLFSMLDESADIGQKIKNFAKKDED